MYICSVWEENPSTYQDEKPPLLILWDFMNTLDVKYWADKLTTWNQAMATIDLP